MQAAATIELLAPLSGLRVPLQRVPDAVFAQRLVGDGVAIDPTSDTVLAPMAGEVLTLHAARHAISLRGAAGVEVLIHIGLDTVLLKGAGFRALVAVGEQVQAGQPLIRFDLDVVARRARSLLTVVLVSNAEARVQLPRLRGPLQAGRSALLQVTLPAEVALLEPLSPPAGVQLASPVLRLPNPAGLHARPAAQLAERARSYRADIQLCLGERRANAKSVVALLGLGTAQGDPVRLLAAGVDAAEALAALQALLLQGCGESIGAAAAEPVLAVPVAPADTALPVDAGQALTGHCASPGIAVGRVLHWRRRQLVVAEQGGEPALERQAFEQARHAARRQIETLCAELGAGTRADILQAHLGLLDDPDLIDATLAGIGQGHSAAFAWRSRYQQVAADLAGMANPLLRERAGDVRDVGERVLALLVGATGEHAGVSVPQGSIVIAEELTPSDTAGLDPQCVRGFATVAGGPSGHVAILARSLGIPALCGIDPAALWIAEGSTVLLDADHARLYPAPSAAQQQAAMERLQQDRQRQLRDLAAAQQGAISRDGVAIEVVANVRDAADTRLALDQGADGVGLLRSEFLFDQRCQAPDEDEQFAAYAAVADALGPSRPLVIRTLDVGGDKPLSYLPLPREDNPFLGLRGIRVGLAHPALLRTQLRAILRVGGRARLHIMLPMVADLAELRAVRRLLQAEAQALGVPVPPLGIMVEVPSAALLAHAFAAEVEFFSIGSNDLTQYTLAMDRGHPQLAAQADALHPAVLRLIAMTCSAARQHGRWVGVCGGLASDPLALPALIGLGVRELSAVAPAIPAVKAMLARLQVADCAALAASLLDLESPAAVRDALAGFTASLS